MKFLALFLLLVSSIGYTADRPVNSWVGKSGQWYCNDGYLFVEDDCKPIIIPKNSYAVGADWFCKDGFLKYNGKCSTPEQLEKSKDSLIGAVIGSRNQTGHVESNTISQSSNSSSDPSYMRSCAENGSCYGDISSYNGKAKTVHIKGYYRKDGTYVRGHYRSK